MKKALGTFLKIGLPLGLGLFLVWYFYQSLTENDKIDIVDAFKRANYFWVLLSLVAATLSHMSRAYRWKYTLEPLGYKPRFANTFMAVMVGYLVNLAIPRLGELSRCGVTAKYEKIPFEKLLGTVIAERVADLLILLSIITLVVFLQYEVISDLLNNTLFAKFEAISPVYIAVFFAIAFVGGLLMLWFIYRLKSENKVVLLIQKIVKGILDGLLTIYTMKHKWLFLAHTLFIWSMYLAMFYLCFFSLPETATVSFTGVFTSFVLGGITIAATNGGIGAYPLAIQAVLVLYNVDANTAVAFGWITWTAQTVMIIVLGGLAFLALPIYNKASNENTAKHSA